MGLKQKIKKTCKSAPAWAFGPHGPCIFRFNSRLEIESDWDKISLDCFPSLRTINMYPLLFVKGERHHVSQTTTLGVSPPLILVIPMFVVLLLVDLLCFVAYHLRISRCLCAVAFQSYASSCRIELVTQRQHPASFVFNRSNLLWFALFLRVCVISARLAFTIVD